MHTKLLRVGKNSRILELFNSICEMQMYSDENNFAQ